MTFSNLSKRIEGYFSKVICKYFQHTIGVALRTLGFFIFFAGESDRSKKELHKVLDDKSLHQCFIYLLILFFVVLVLAVVFGPFVSQRFLSPTTFNVSAVTEEVKVVTPNVPMSSWPVSNATLSKSCPEEGATQNIQFTGSISIKPLVQITFTRIAFDKLVVMLFNENEKTSVGELYDSNDEYVGSLTSCAFFVINNISELVSSGKTIVFPITGKITAGNEIRFLTQTKNPVLREGKVTILDRSFVFGEHYSVGPFDLETGDSFEIRRHTVPSQGFVLINEKPAINLVYRAKAFRGVIKRYQSENFELRNSYWSKIYNDESLSLSWLLIAILFNVIRVYLRFLVN